MKLDINVRTKTVEVKEISNAYKKDEVLGYCSNCSNFGNNYSCPSKTYDPVEVISEYNYVTLIITEVKTAEIKEFWGEIEMKDYPSQVYTNYMKKYPDTPSDTRSQLSMYVFNKVKDQVTDILMQTEEDWKNTYGAPPGSCSKCERCTMTDGEPCIHPDQLRYSLEAFGYKVSDLYTSVFDMELTFTRGELPEAFTSCSGIFSKEPLGEGQIREKLMSSLSPIIL